MKDVIMQVIKERRSVRNFEDKAVPDDLLQTVLEAVQWTPSWANTQCWEIVVIKDPEVKARVQEAVPKSNPAFKSIVNAPVVLALCARLNDSGYYKNAAVTKFGDWFMFDLGLATQSIVLAAHAAGLGTVIAGLFDHDKAASAVNMPAGHELVVLIPMGFPSKVPSAPKRKEISEFTRENTF
ncbi:MAG: nitroreductase family protein [Desulfosalsimonadaceae bacterium]